MGHPLYQNNFPINVSKIIGASPGRQLVYVGPGKSWFSCILLIGYRDFFFFLVVLLGRSAKGCCEANKYCCEPLGLGPAPHPLAALCRPNSFQGPTHIQAVYPGLAQPDILETIMSGLLNMTVPSDLFWVGCLLGSGKPQPSHARSPPIRPGEATTEKWRINSSPLEMIQIVVR